VKKRSGFYPLVRGPMRAGSQVVSQVVCRRRWGGARGDRSGSRLGSVAGRGRWRRGVSRWRCVIRRRFVCRPSRVALALGGGLPGRHRAAAGGAGCPMAGVGVGSDGLPPGIDVLAADAGSGAGGDPGGLGRRPGAGAWRLAGRHSPDCGSRRPPGPLVIDVDGVCCVPAGGASVARRRYAAQIASASSVKAVARRSCDGASVATSVVAAEEILQRTRGRRRSWRPPRRRLSPRIGRSRPFIRACDRLRLRLLAYCSVDVCAGCRGPVRRAPAGMGRLCRWSPRGGRRPVCQRRGGEETGGAGGGVPAVRIAERR